MDHPRALTLDQLPPCVRDLSPPPKVLYAVGSLPPAPWVAIVGTRKATEEGLAFARRLATDLVECGIVIASGGASGIDTAAHEGALDAGGQTVVVGPSSWDRPFPADNRELFRRVVDRGGAFVSRHESECPSRRAQFFLRNALLVAFCRVLIVAQTRVSGGSTNAAAHARRLRRPIFAVTDAPWTQMGEGALSLIGQGAAPLVSVAQVVTAVRDPSIKVRGNHAFGAGRKLKRARNEQQRLFGDPQAPQETAMKSHWSRLRGEALRVAEMVRNGASTPDEICLKTGLSASRVQEVLLTLTLEGILVSHPSGHVSLSRS